MKKLILSIGLLFGLNAFADLVDVPVEYEIVEAQAYCINAGCTIDGETGEQKCRLKVRYADEDYQLMQTIKEEKGYNKTWLEKSPYELCSTGELPMEGEGTANVRVMLYKMDLSVLTNLF